MTRTDELPAAFASSLPDGVEEALGAEYPGVRCVVGEPTFRALAKGYFLDFPPRSREALDGGRFPAFLEAHVRPEDARAHLQRMHVRPKDAKAYPEGMHVLPAGLPFLADLARLERMVSEAADAEDVPPLAWETVRDLGSDEAWHLPLVARPGTGLLRSAWPVVDLWRLRHAASGPDLSADMAGRSQSALVVRPWSTVYVHVLSDDEADLLSAALSSSATLALLLPEDDDARALRLAAAFRRLVLLGVFAEEPRLAVARGDSATCLPRLTLPATRD